MRVLIATILVFSFIGIAMLGFISMSHKAGLAHNNCFVARTQGAACAGRNVFEIISLHFNALRSFGLAIFLAQIFTAIAAIILINTNGGIKAFAPPTLYSLAMARESGAPPFNLLLLRWLALHENSPAYN